LSSQKKNESVEVLIINSGLVPRLIKGVRRDKSKLDEANSDQQPRKNNEKRKPLIC
jgi:hypothetical protein